MYNLFNIQRNKLEDLKRLYRNLKSSLILHKTEEKYELGFGGEGRSVSRRPRSRVFERQRQLRNKN
jgi:hypothetical protein